jgi:hypothetical protein
MLRGARRLTVLVIATFAIFGLHGVAVAAPDGACVDAARHHAQVVDVADVEVTSAGIGAATIGDGVAIPLAILISAFLVMMIRRSFVTVPVDAGVRMRRQLRDQPGRSPPLRSRLSVWRI